MNGYRFNKGMTILQTMKLSMTMTQIAQKKTQPAGHYASFNPDTDEDRFDRGSVVQESGWRPTIRCSPA